MFWRKKEKLNLLDLSHISKVEQQDIKRLFSRVFSSEEGQKIIAYLTHITYSRNLPAESSNEALRFMEGQRAIITTIRNYIQQGKNN